MKHYVYMIKADQFVKVGVAKNPEKRLEQMQTGSPYELEIIALLPFITRSMAFEYENHLHRRLRRFHFRGEWFSIECLGIAFKQAASHMSKKKQGVVTIDDDRWQKIQKRPEK